jgi:hypothetical protein
MGGGRIALFAVIGALTLTALLAIAIVLFGRFGQTEGRILGTTMLLALFGLLALPAALLLDQGRMRALAWVVLVLAAAGFTLATTLVWMGDDPPSVVVKLTATVVAFGLASTQTAALAARMRDADPAAVQALYRAATALVLVLAAAGSAAVWAEVEAQAFFRAFAAGAVLDVLLVALQPVLALVRRGEHRYVLHLRLDPPADLEVTVEASRLARAAARAIDSAEAAGSRVVAVELVAERRSAAERGPALG